MKLQSSIKSFSFVAMLAAASVVSFAPQASAQASLSATCTSSGQNCNRRLPFTFNSDGPGAEYAVTLKAPATHCSAVRYTLVSRNGDILGGTGFLNAGESTLVSLGDNLAKGRQTVFIQAQGKIGGCNSGRLGSWGVEATSTVVPR